SKQNNKKPTLQAQGLPDARVTAAVTRQAVEYLADDLVTCLLHGTEAGRHLNHTRVQLREKALAQRDLQKGARQRVSTVYGASPRCASPPPPPPEVARPCWAGCRPPTCGQGQS